MFTWLLQEVRELQELQKTLYTFVHVMANHDLSSVFIAPNCMGYLDAMMQLLLLTACSHKDILLRKVRERVFGIDLVNIFTNIHVDVTRLY